MEKIEDIVENDYVQKLVRFINIVFCVSAPSVLTLDVEDNVPPSTQPLIPHTPPSTPIDKKVSPKYIQLPPTPIDKKVSPKYIQPPPAPIDNVTLFKYVPPPTIPINKKVSPKHTQQNITIDIIEDYV